MSYLYTVFLSGGENLTNMDKEKDIERREGEVSGETAAAPREKHILVWASVVLAVIAWIVLLWSDGYVALAVAVLACVAGFLGAARGGRPQKRLAIAAIIASMVLVVVLAAFLIVIKVGLG